jgi:hypothetical protein
MCSVVIAAPPRRVAFYSERSGAREGGVVGERRGSGRSDRISGRAGTAGGADRASTDDRAKRRDSKPGHGPFAGVAMGAPFSAGSAA